MNKLTITDVREITQKALEDKLQEKTQKEYEAAWVVIQARAQMGSYTGVHYLEDNMQYALYSIPDGYFLDHSRSSLLRTVEAKEAYVNNHNVVVVGYERTSRGKLLYKGEYARKRLTNKPLADKEAVQDALTWLSKIKR